MNFESRAVPHAAMRARQIQVVRRLVIQTPSVKPAHFARIVEDRNHNAPVKAFIRPLAKVVLRTRSMSDAALRTVWECRVAHVRPEGTRVRFAAFSKKSNISIERQNHETQRT